MTETTMTVTAARLDPELGWHGRRITVNYRRGFARVELNRDGWVDLHPESDELMPDLEEALDRCREAGIFRIWLNGVTTGFSWGGGGRWITLFVPTADAKAAIEALKAAELHGDLFKLERLTKRLAPPLDKWLAPGERYLRLGVDFTCTPARFLHILRGEVKARKLQLNGRVDGDGVWVRPVLDRIEHLTRQMYPERHPEPDPYAAGSSEPSLRPPAPARSRSAARRSEVRRMWNYSIPDQHKCPCGWSQDDDHLRRHAEWAIGVPVPQSVPFTESVAVVPDDGPMRWHQLAYRCARVAQRSGGYDFASFPYPSSITTSTEGMRAYLLAANKRVVGYLSVMDRDRHAFLRFGKGGDLVYNDHTIRPWVCLIFVANEWRRHGVGRRLVTALAEDTRVGIADISWSMPFTTAGRSLAQAVSPEGVWVS